MCVWTSIVYGCGHHETRTEMCRMKMVARDAGFTHSVNCDLVDAYIEQPRSCSACQRKVLATISQPHTLGQDPRDQLPSQRGNLQNANTQDGRLSQPPQPPPTLESILRKQRKTKIWQGCPEATGLEVTRLEARGINPFPDHFPADGRVVGEDGQLWLTAAAHEKQHQPRIPRIEVTYHQTLREAYKAAEPGQQSNSDLRGKPIPSALQIKRKAVQESASAQPKTELLDTKQQDKVTPSCLVPNNPAQNNSFARLSAEFNATRIARRDYATPNTTEVAPQGNVANLSRTDTIDMTAVSTAEKQQDAALANYSMAANTTASTAANANKPSLLPPQLPQSKRISPLHFEGTILESLREIN